MDGDGYDFFSQESAGGNTWMASASDHGGAAPFSTGVEGFDLNSQVADGFPHLGDTCFVSLCERNLGTPVVAQVDCEDAFQTTVT
jgi:hypothetical protein